MKGFVAYIIVVVLVIAASALFTEWVWNSDLPSWLKFFLIR